MLAAPRRRGRVLRTNSPGATSDMSMDNYAPLIDVLVAFYEEVDKQHRAQAADPVVRFRLHMALDSILDGRARFKRDARPELSDLSSSGSEPSGSPTQQP